MLANLGYLAIGKESTKGTAVTPSVFVPYYSEDVTTKVNLDEDVPIMGHSLARHRTLQGQRSHTGSITVLAEPNTAGHFFNMLLTRTSTTGSDPYTHTFQLSSSTAPASYTIDIQRNDIVSRYFGVEASKIDIDFDENKMTFTIDISALGSFLVREIASISGSGPYTITLKTNYDPAPTRGLVVGDTMRGIKTNLSMVDFTVATIANETQLTTSQNVSSLASGDLIYLRSATPSYNLRDPFLWSNTEFRFNDTASSALTTSQIRLEKGSKWTITHEFEEEEGSMRSGGFDPAALLRTVGDVEITTKQVFSLAHFSLNRYLSNLGRALVIRHFSEDKTLELRVTINRFKFLEHPIETEAGDIIYVEAKLAPEYHTGDGQGFDVKVINKIATI